MITNQARCRWLTGESQKLAERVDGSSYFFVHPGNALRKRKRKGIATEGKKMEAAVVVVDFFLGKGLVRSRRKISCFWKLDGWRCVVYGFVFSRRFSKIRFARKIFLAISVVGISGG